MLDRTGSIETFENLDNIQYTKWTSRQFFYKIKSSARNMKEIWYRHALGGVPSISIYLILNQAAYHSKAKLFKYRWRRMQLDQLRARLAYGLAPANGKSIWPGPFRAKYVCMSLLGFTQWSPIHWWTSARVL